MTLRQNKNTDIKSKRVFVTQKFNVKYCIKLAQQHMIDLVNNLNYRPFDNTVVPTDCVDRLVAHRITSKFHIEDSSSATKLQSEAFSNYIEYDRNLSAKADFAFNLDLLRARYNLREWFKDFSINIKDCRYEVTPGETFISSSGEVSLEAKLFHKKHWTTTANCLDDTCVFIYNNLAFKRAATQHIKHATTRLERRKTYLRFRNSADVGFNVFRHFLIDRVLTIVDGARASSVPKSNDKRRFINVEAMFPVILQRVVSFEIKRILRVVGNDLGTFDDIITMDHFGIKTVEHISAQHLHGKLIKDQRYSTIDFKNASDSVTISAVCSLFPKQVSDYLLKYRSHYVEIDGEFHEPLKLSSMGNGFTFEVMTAMLYAIARSMTDDCRVYGDDVILPNEFSPRFVAACELVDFRINESKTFINSFFRESCGYFYSDHHGYITSFDFNQIRSYSDIIITCNKLTMILEQGLISPDLRNILILTRDRINALTHASRKGPVPRSVHMQRQYMALYVFDEGYTKKQRRSKDLSSLRQHYIEKNDWFFRGCQIDISGVSLIYCPFFVPDKSKLLFTNMNNYERYLPFLYSGKNSKSLIKGKGKWVDLPAFVFPDGTITLLSNLISSRNVWVDRLNGVINHRDNDFSHHKVG